MRVMVTSPRLMLSRSSSVPTRVALAFLLGTDRTNYRDVLCVTDFSLQREELPRIVRGSHPLVLLLVFASWYLDRSKTDYNPIVRQRCRDRRRCIIRRSRQEKQTAGYLRCQAVWIASGELEEKSHVRLINLATDQTQATVVLKH